MDKIKQQIILSQQLQQFNINKSVIGTVEYEIYQDIQKGFSESEILEKTSLGVYESEAISKGGKRAAVGEIRTFGDEGKKYQKQANGSWRPVKKDGGGDSKKEDKDKIKKKIDISPFETKIKISDKFAIVKSKSGFYILLKNKGVDYYVIYKTSKDFNEVYDHPEAIYDRKSKEEKDQIKLEEFKKATKEIIERIKTSYSSDGAYQNYKKFVELYSKVVSDNTPILKEHAGRMGDFQSSYFFKKDKGLGFSVVDKMIEKIPQITNELEKIGLKVVKKIDHGSYSVSGGIYNGKTAKQIDLLVDVIQ